MTRVLIAYDASDAARAALAAAAALFPAAETIVVTVHPPSPEPESAGMARVALPESVIREGLENMRSEHEREAQETADAGAAAFAFLAGHDAATAIVPGASAWRALRDEAVRCDADVLVCGTHAKGRLDRWMLGSTASSLVHHLELPLLIVPEGEAELRGAGDGGLRRLRGRSGGVALRRRASRRAADRGRPRLAVADPAHPARPCPRGLAASACWRSTRRPSTRLRPRSPRTPPPRARRSPASSAWTPRRRRTSPVTASGARCSTARSRREAAALLVGSRGRGAVASTVLGSVASGLVHAAALPVLVVPGGGVENAPQSETN